MADDSALKFSTDDDSLLIDLVRNYEVLWKSSHPEFKSSLKKDAIWVGIGQQLNKSAGFCKRRWKHIRDHFMREKKDIMTGSGKAAKRKKRALYWENLSFLNKVEDDRQSCTNVGEEEEIEKDTVEAPNLYMAEKHGSESDFNYEADPTTMHIDTEDHQSGECDEEDGPTFVRHIRSTPTNKESLTKSITINKDGKRNILLQQRQTDKNVEKIYALEQKALEDENDLFFKSMAAIVKKFDRRNQALARKKVFAVVSDLELLQC